MEDLKVINVRAMIDLFEDNCRNDTAQLLNRSMSKSFGGLSFSERKYKANYSDDNDILYHLNQRLTSLCYKLKDYKNYAKEIHVAFQEELVEIMTILIDMDIKNNTFIYRKKEVMLDIKACFNELSIRLPATSSDNINHGFADFSYKPFSWKRPNSIAGVGPNAKDSTKALDISKDTPLSTRVVKPQRTRSVVESYAKSFQQPSQILSRSQLEISDRKSNKESADYITLSDRRPFNSSDFVTLKSNSREGVDLESLRTTGSVTNSVNQSPDYEGVVYESLSSPSSFKKSFDLIMGGAAGTRSPVNLSHIDKTTAITSPKSNDVSPRAKYLQRSSSEISQDDVVKRSVTIGRSESAKRWTYGELRGRRRPVSLGGTVVTLNSPEDIISSLNFSHDITRSSEKILHPRDQDEILQKSNHQNVFTEIQDSNDRPEDENSLQSVQLLKRLFEPKSGETENQEQQKSFNAQEDQRGYFREGVQSTEESIQAGGYHKGNFIREDSNDSSTKTIVEVEVEDDEIAGSERVALSRISSIIVDEVEGLNRPVLRHEQGKEDDEGFIASSVSEDLEEVGSISSEKSIYLDPVD